MQRYTLDLSEFYSDHRQKIFVGRRVAWKRVDCLLEYVRNTFQLADVCLTNQDNVLFPETEDLDVILASDQVKVRRISNSYNGTHNGRSPPVKTFAAEPRVGQQNGSYVQQESDSSSSESDVDCLPKIFVGLEKLNKSDEALQELPKPKRKRIRKRKSKKNEDPPPPKVIVKTYGKNKMPSIVTDNEAEKKHIRFTEDDLHKEDECIEEPYRNLNKSTTPRIVRASLQAADAICNDDAPSVPEYEDTPIIELEDVIRKKGKNRQPRKSLAIKQELISANVSNGQASISPTCTDKVDKEKETFLANYSGFEFWNNLVDALENFPLIAIPSENDIIAYRYAETDYLAFVERADDGEDDTSPALKLTLRQLNTDNAEQIMVALDHLTKIRLVATYQR
ncbi:uncharacterized protein LOC128743467 [Sabethes cyaneus]|uniref:uncharacterized protein LOC128743467 n=1 Tax=Sabethes cyaneus TaxID=53552 RepID=UPI00237D3336|nr:uncharacterized protein LOC128743467 [Sabethes cyaneus]